MRWLWNILDLLTGRVHGTLRHLDKKQGATAQTIKSLVGRINNMTENEQIITNAAASIRNSTTKIETATNNMTNLIEQLRTELGNGHPVVEDLSDELADLQDAIGGLGNVAGRLTPSVPEAPAPTVPANGGVTVMGQPSDTLPTGIEPVQPSPGTQVPVQAEPEAQENPFGGSDDTMTQDTTTATGTSASSGSGDDGDGGVHPTDPIQQGDGVFEDQPTKADDLPFNDGPLTDNQVATANEEQTAAETTPAPATDSETEGFFGSAESTTGTEPATQTGDSTDGVPFENEDKPNS